MDIRPRTDSDLDACEALAAVVGTVDGYPPHLPHELRRFIVSPDAIEAWVVEEHDQIVGQVSLNRRTSDEVLALACDVLDKPVDALGVIARLFVAPARRGTGSGRKTPADGHGGGPRPGARAPILDVATHFKPAIALYEKHGWQRIGSVTVVFRERHLHEFVYVGPGALMRSGSRPGGELGA